METPIVLINTNHDTTTLWSNVPGLIAVINDGYGSERQDNIVRRMAEEMDTPKKTYVQDLTTKMVKQWDSPTPIDWVLEAEKIARLREKVVPLLRQPTFGNYSEEFLSRQDTGYLLKLAAREQVLAAKFAGGNEQ